VNQLAAFLLSVAWVYLGGDSNVWGRLALVLCICFVLLLALFTALPYRPEKVFSGQLQISLICISVLVILAGVAGSLSSPRIAKGVTEINNRTASAFIGFVSPNSSTIEYEHGSAARAASAFAYLSFIAMVLAAAGLIYSFFRALRTGARNESKQQLVDSAVSNPVSSSKTKIELPQLSDTSSAPFRACADDGATAPKSSKLLKFQDLPSSRTTRSDASALQTAACVQESSAAFEPVATRRYPTSSILELGSPAEISIVLLIEIGRR
jgi:hypothetical protein